MFIVVLSDGKTWDVDGHLIEISEEEYIKLNASGDLDFDNIKVDRCIPISTIVTDDGSDLSKHVRTEDLDPVIKSHRRELVNRLRQNIRNCCSHIEIADYLSK